LIPAYVFGCWCHFLSFTFGSKPVEADQTQLVSDGVNISYVRTVSMTLFGNLSKRQHNNKMHMSSGRWFLT
jgi:hypothetical protein